MTGLRSLFFSSTDATEENTGSWKSVETWRTFWCSCSPTCAEDESCWHGRGVDQLQAGCAFPAAGELSAWQLRAAATGRTGAQNLGPPYFQTLFWIFNCFFFFFFLLSLQLPFQGYDLIWKQGSQIFFYSVLLYWKQREITGWKKIWFLVFLLLLYIF